MEMVQPTTWADALAAKAADPELLPIAGGTDVMVEMNFDRRRPTGLLDLTRVDELRTWSVDSGTVALGELGLGGEVRPVSQLEARLKEAARLGATHAIVPHLGGRKLKLGGMALREVRRLSQAMGEVM